MNDKKIMGLIDYNVFHAENGHWYVSKTIHEKTSPGDDSPEDGGIVHECSTKEEAVHKALESARTTIGKREAHQSGVFVDGEALAFHTWNDDVWCYPPHQDDSWRIWPGATNAWMGTIETKGGDEVLDLTVWACEDFQAAFKFAQEVVKLRNKMRLNLTLEDYE